MATSRWRQFEFKDPHEGFRLTPGGLEVMRRLASGEYTPAQAVAALSDLDRELLAELREDCARALRTLQDAQMQWMEENPPEVRAAKRASRKKRVRVRVVR